MHFNVLAIVCLLKMLFFLLMPNPFVGTKIQCMYFTFDQFKTHLRQYTYIKYILYMVKVKIGILPNILVHLKVYKVY